MIKNVRTHCERSIPLQKTEIHSIVGYLKKTLDLEINNLEVNFITSDELLEINKKYLQHEYRTDVITFSYSKNKDVIDGEILISIEDARSNAHKYNIPQREEFIRLIIHGSLHLIGYTDCVKSEKCKMDLLQENLLKNFIALK
jgi:rRNA maturation RNase YbeY